MANRLSEASSPYLRQHAHQPIDWWPWGEEAFAEAARRDVPVLVSIGYSACHWCHVMAHESFSDDEVARVVNESCVAIKVDREEHPDVDQVFMHVTQALTGRGGWPNTVFTTPDGQPFFAGTYFPPTPREGMPSFVQVVQAISEAYQTRRDELLTTAHATVEELVKAGRVPQDVPSAHVDPVRLLMLLNQHYDVEHGGFGHEPKFPQAPVLDALFVRPDPINSGRGLYTLEAMSRGGIFDQVGGGFHRYAVDHGWEVPHFEKMLSDNALLISTYTRGWLHATPDDGTEQRERLHEVVRRTIAWLAEEMQLEGGAFAASLDADSLNEDGEPEEGAYYLWSPQLFDEYLGKDSRFAQGVFHVTYGGNLPRGAHEPTDGTGRSTLQFHGNPHPERVLNVLETLKRLRQERPAPARDDKVIAEWNGYLAESLSYAGMIFGRPEWVQMARQAAEYLWQAHWDGERQILARTTLAADGADDGLVVGPDGVLADYAAVALGYLRLGCALGESEWIERAVTLVDRALELFDDGQTVRDAVSSPLLFNEARRLDDEALPSGNAVLMVVLRQLGSLVDRADYAECADRIAEALNSIVVYSPRYSGWALAELISRAEARWNRGPAQVCVISDDPFNPMTQAAWRLAPWGSVVVTGAEGTDGFGHLFEERRGADGEAVAYVCHGTTCEAPTSDWNDLRALLRGAHA